MLNPLWVRRKRAQVDARLLRRSDMRVDLAPKDGPRFFAGASSPQDRCRTLANTRNRHCHFQPE